MNSEELKNADQMENEQLYGAIADHICNRPEDYKEAGKWLDDYCSESKVRRRMVERLNELEKQIESIRQREEKSLEDSRNRLGRLLKETPKADKARIKKLREKLKKLEAVSIDETVQQYGVFKSYQILKERLGCDGQPVSKARQITEAWDFAVSKENPPKLDRILLIGWLLTKKECDKRKPGLTSFEDWQPGAATDDLDQEGGRKAACDFILYQFPERGIKILRRAYKYVSGKSAKKTQQANVNLTDTEQNILEALGSEVLKGKDLLHKAGYDYSGHYRQILSNLVKRGVLSRKLEKGYYKAGQ